MKKIGRSAKAFALQAAVVALSTVAMAQQPPATPPAAPAWVAVKPIDPPATPLASEAASAAVTRFSFLAYGDTRSDGNPNVPGDGDIVHPEHTRVMDGMLAKVRQLEATPFPVRFVLQSGDAVLRGQNAAMWNVSFTPIIERLTRDANLPYFFSVGNHDVTRIASQLTDERHLAHALVILMTCAGLPSIYAGDEQAFRGVKEHRAGGDDAIRPVFPAMPAGLAPFGWPVYRLHQELIGLRRRHPWLHRARSRVTELRNTDFTFEAYHGEQRLWVALNLADAAVVRTIPAAVDRLAGDVALRRKGASTGITLPPHGWAILG